MKALGLLLMLALLCSSCMYADKSRVVMLGGKGMAKGKTTGPEGGSYAVMWDGEDSFRVGAAAAAMVGGTIANAVATKATEETARAVSANAAAVKTTEITSAAAVKTAEINAGVETAKIATQTPVPTP